MLPEVTSDASETFPRSVDRGLIEASFFQSSGFRLVLRFPRSVDRGLIEAIQMTRGHNSPSTAFRDLLIAASLKLPGPLLKGKRPGLLSAIC